MKLEELFIETFAYVLAFLRHPSGDCEQLRARVTTLVDAARAESRKTLIGDEDFQLALFPLIAWVDESVLCSDWPEANQWRKAPLQKSLFKTIRAGAEFYDRLEALEPRQREIRGVYYMALALGFRGKYNHPADHAMLERLKRGQLEMLEGGRGGALSQNRPIFSMAYPPEAPVTSAPPQDARRFQALAGLLIGPAVVVLGLYLTYQLILEGMVRHILSISG
ncbi:MAG: DotU family type IV/VI secretion system protein [Candidatus Binataceae bacterium]